MNVKDLTKRLLGHVAVSFALLIALCGCADVRESPLGPRYHATNIFETGNFVARNLRRVAVIPLAPGDSSSDVQAGVEMLEPVLLTELQKRNRFELAVISRAELIRWTGRQNLRGDDVLPQNFIERVKKETGCDGIFFATLTVFRPYTPAAIGWRLKLITVSDRTIIWAADEVFDASSPDVVNSARDYQRKQPELVAGLREGRKILLSPTAFGHYSSGVLLDTLPPRPR